MKMLRTFGICLVLLALHLSAQTPEEVAALQREDIIRSQHRKWKSTVEDESFDHKNHRFMASASPPNRIIDLSRLADDIHYPEDQVSLIPDFKDQHDGRVAVYLVNATGHSLKKALGSGGFAMREIRTDKGWKPSFRPIFMCGDGLDSRFDLPAGQAAATFSAGDHTGEVEAEMRYVYYPGSITGPKVMSATFRGRYDPEELTTEDPLPYRRPIDELTKNEIFTICLRALGIPIGTNTPEASISLNRLEAWQTLARICRPDDTWLSTEAEKEDLELQHGDCPRKVDRTTLQRLIDEARDTLQNPGEEAKAAGEVLLSPWITASMVPNAEFEAYLESESAVVRRIGYLGLMHRGSKAARYWLSERIETDEEEIFALWKECYQNRPSVPEDEDNYLFAGLLKHGEDGVLWELLHRYPEQTYDKRRAMLPPDLDKALVEFFRKRRDQTVTSMQEVLFYSALRMLSRSELPESQTVLRDYLRHPQIAYWKDDSGQPVKGYPVRLRAAALLKEKGETIPADVILKEPATEEEVRRFKNHR